MLQSYGYVAMRRDGPWHAFPVLPDEGLCLGPGFEVPDPDPKDEGVMIKDVDYIAWYEKHIAK